MARLTEEIKTVADKSFVWILSTVNDDGSPRSIPVHFKKIISDEEVMVVNNYMNTTLNNLKARPDKVSLTLWESGTVCHFNGSACIDTSEKPYQQAVKMVKEKFPELNPKSVVIIKVTSVQKWHRPK